MISTVPSDDRAALLLPLLRSLTARTRNFVVWKNADMALSGIGDVDCVAPQELWNLLVAEVTDWAEAAKLGPVIVCDHVPDGMFVIALNGTNEFLQLDVRSRVSFRGAVAFSAKDLAPLVQMDTRGFRRLRPGAEGLLKLVLKGIGWNGQPRLDKLQSERVLELIDQDLPGVGEAAALFKPLSRILISAAEGARGGKWDRRAMLALEAVSCLKALTELPVAFSRARSRLRGASRCLVVEASIEGSRRPPGKDYLSWLRQVSKSHRVLRAEALLDL